MITTTIYVDYKNKEVLSELAYVQRVIEQAKKNESDLDAFENFLVEYLHYDILLVYQMNETAKDMVWKEWKDYCLQWATDDLGFQFDEVEIQI